LTEIKSGFSLFQSLFPVGGHLPGFLLVMARTGRAGLVPAASQAWANGNKT
jgi:hypothetical protein